MPTEPVLIIALSGVLIIAAVQDILFQKISNALTYPTIAAACVYHCFESGIQGFFFSSGGLILGIALLILPYLMGGMGAGDAKLLGVVGAVLGARGVFLAFLLTSLFGGVYALVLLTRHHDLIQSFQRYGTALKTSLMTKASPPPRDEDFEKPKLCYGIAIALGTWLAILLEVTGYSGIINL